MGVATPMPGGPVVMMPPRPPLPPQGEFSIVLRQSGAELPENRQRNLQRAAKSALAAWTAIARDVHHL
jgi:hypothetical protein